MQQRLQSNNSQNARGANRAVAGSSSQRSPRSLFPEDNARDDLEDDEAKPYMNPQMEALLSKRQDQLEKAIARYNADNDALARQKSQYDNLLRKVKADQRDLDA